MAWAELTSAFAPSYGLKEHKFHGEAASVDPNAIVDEWARLKKISARYKEDNQFNIDETYANPFNTPDRGMATHEISGKKKNKFRITIALACSTSDTEKLPPFFIGKYAKPRYFQKQSGGEFGFYY
jgi:hypothetical protein